MAASRRAGGRAGAPAAAPVLQYDRTVKIGETLAPMPGAAIMLSLADMIAHHVEVAGLENLPSRGR